jgi:hypothetical protein
MSISMTTREVRIICPYIFCDICNRTSDAFEQLDVDGMTLSRADPAFEVSMWRFGSGPLCTIAGIPSTIEAAYRWVLSLGWKQEILYGRTMCICPSCQAGKGTI